ncbi:Protein kinase superfamily protein [Raphanus sativus]|uniref:Mitogen-activated protein kinase kinase kinase 20-like n=1 Tax=Raphanus sativus TaxID=3726 RepID=A0A6J0JLC5_RAPSA|nr:mitogen-activated protein kinase kinase kinase 20-like [Raphanus sativus]KAJ4892157.1 Protein kinase superfamily protein [Raphanus sativus]
MPSMEFMKPLGKGAYGSVDLMRITKPDDGSEPCYHAVKSSYAHDYESLRKEFRILSKLRNCPRIVQTLGSSLERGVDDYGVRVYKMSMEYAAGGSLASFMETRSLRDSMIRDFTLMILQGLVSIHSRGYVHCDLKPENLLLFPRHESFGGGLKSTYELKICDFGMSTKAGEESEFWEFDSPFLGTPLYMSPESVQDGVAERALDLWSLGCVVLEMYTGEGPWPFADSKDLLPELLSGNGPEIPQSLPWEARQFLKTCLARNPDERGSAEELLKHPFLRNVSDDQKKVMVTGAAGSRREPAVVLESKDAKKKPLRVKIIPPKPLQFKKVSHRPLRLKIIPPKPPGCKLIQV